MDQIIKYMNQLIESSTPECPMWNIEKIRNGKASRWNYIDGCMIKAIIEMYYITNDKKYLDFADSFIDYFILEDGLIKDFDSKEKNIDNINEGKVLFDLYEITGKEKYKKAIDFLYNELMNHPRIPMGNFWHKKIYPNQVWLDGLYMAQPFYIEYETKFNKLGNYKDIFNQFINVDKYLKDSVTGLYYHGYDDSRKMHWCDKETGLSKNFWIRAMGWFVMALVDTIEKMDPQMFYEYRTLIDILKNAIDSLIKYQDESGMWYQVIDKGHLEGNYLETSGSAMISYGILKAVRLEYIPKRYKIYGEKAFKGIVNKYLRLEGDNLSLGGICLVAGLGGKDMRDGSYEYYISEPIVENDAKGVAPFLLAYTEILRNE